MILIGILTALVDGADPAATGPETEKRFPRLTVPAGFNVTLFACDPLIEYPSVIAIGPEPKSLFVAHDYVTGLGVEIVRRDEIRLVRDTNGDGYADTSTVYAKEFNSIQGLAFHDDAVYVMHAPLLTALKDTNGDGVADERRDLFGGLGLPPEENDNRLHCANGVVAGHDGWLYLALGDRGCSVQRPEGDRLVFREGGILRCRPDGRDLHVFSHGLRNIYDVVLDDELNVFVRDNENDGGDYMIRVCHCFHGSDHGYPYLYYERPDEAMQPLADLGRGSSAGGTAYLETAFPQEYRDSLFFCEWGRAVVRYRKQTTDSSFAQMQEVDFAAGAADDPYGFKPTDLVVDRDGSLLISDWCDGQRPKRGRGRIYRIAYQDDSATTDAAKRASQIAPTNADTPIRELLQRLDAEQYHIRLNAQMWIERRGQAAVAEVLQALQQRTINVRGRLHAVWIVARFAEGPIDELFRVSEQDPDPRVRVQAIRALADLSDPILAQHRIAGGKGDESVCKRLAKIGSGAEPRIKMEVMITLGRLHWDAAPDWLRENWADCNAASSHAAMVLLRRAENWSAVLELLDLDGPSAKSKPPLRTVALRALANQADPIVVDGLVRRVKQETSNDRRGEYCDLLARVYKRPAEWTYWGFRPAPRPANPAAWERTPQIEQSLNQAIQDSDSAVRARVVRRMLREEVPVSLPSLTQWLNTEFGSDGVAAILDALTKRPVAEVRGLLEKILTGEMHAIPNRLRALARFTGELDPGAEQRLVEIGRDLPDGPVLAEVIKALGKVPANEVATVLLSRLHSKDRDVRAAVVKSLADRPTDGIALHLKELLRDSDVRIRKGATILCGKLNQRELADQVIDFAADTDVELRSISLEALRAMQDSRAVEQAVKALDYPDAQLAALAYVAEFGGPDQLTSVEAAAARSRSVDVLTAAVRTLNNLQKKSQDEQVRSRVQLAIARIQGACGALVEWRVRGPISKGNAAAELTIASTTRPRPLEETGKPTTVEGSDALIAVNSDDKQSSLQTWLGTTEVFLERPEHIEFLASSQGKMNVMLNGQQIFDRNTNSVFRPDSDRFEADLPQGISRLVVSIDGESNLKFHLRFRRKSSQADLEKLTQFALKEPGNVDRGRELFLNAEKSQCGKCHRIGEEGPRIGPDLAAIGSRFSRVHLIESILEPSRTVAPSYETWSVILTSGRVLTGVKVSENTTTLILGDDQGKTHEIPKAEIDESQSQPKSTMPEGLQKRLTDREFADLVAFLLSQRKKM